MIEGEPGSGKTTFMKAVCRAWSEKIKKQTTDQNEKDSDMFNLNVGKYTILLAFILRQVTNEDNLIKLMKSQFSLLSCPEVYAVLNKIENSPNEVCLMFDGFDELKEERKVHSNDLLDIMTRKTEQDIIGITTTRSQGISQLNRYNAKAIQARVKLCGFNEKQIKKYISLYFKMKDEETSPMEAQIKKENMWTLASIPIRLQMMCFIWKTFQKLGRNTAELYKLLELALLHHKEKREGFQDLTPEKEILYKYNDTILLPTCRLANRWDKHDNLIILFPFSTIKKITGDNYKQVMNYGCLTKYFSASPMEEAIWNFSHLSLQEYYVAKLIANDSDDFSQFEKRCINIQSLEKYLVIVEFLCSLASEKANKIISTVSRQVFEERKCVKILKCILSLTDAYEKLACVDLPLPRHVVLGGKSIDVDFSSISVQKSLSHLFSRDHEKHKNMAILKVHQINVLPYQAKFEYLKGLYITISHTSELERARNLLSQLSEAACIVETVFADDINSQVDKKELFYDIGTKSIEVFSVKGLRVTLLAADIINQQTKLEVLGINDTDVNYDNTKGLREMCDQANKSENLREIIFSGCLLGKSLISLKKDVEVTVCSQFGNACQFNRFAEELAQNRPNITKLDLSYIKIQRGTKKNTIEGKWIALIMISMQSLIILKLRCCGLTTRTISEIVKELDGTSNKVVSLKNWTYLETR